MSAERRYLFAPLEQRGIVAGLRGGQIAVVGAALLTTVALVRLAPPGPAVLGSGGVVTIAVLVAFLDVGGRGVEQWAPVVARFTALRSSGRTRARPSAPTTRCRSSGAGVAPIAVPPTLARLSFDEVAQGPGCRPMAVVTDRTTGVRVAVLTVRGRSFALLDAPDQIRRLEAWGDLLSALAREGGPVCRLQWVQRSLGGDSEMLQQHFVNRRFLSEAAAPVQSYKQLIQRAASLVKSHECFVAIGIRRGVDTSVLAREVRLLEGQLRTAEIEVGSALTLRELAAVIRNAYSPDDRVLLTRRGGLHPDLAGSSMKGAWPAAADHAWASLRTDRTWHATFWVAEWPRTAVGPDFLSPLLLKGSHFRSLAVVMAPSPHSEGVRQAEAARTATVADEELRRRAGFLRTARRRQEALGLARTEAELSDGHAAFRFASYVTVSADDPDALEESCSQTVQLAHQCRLDLRRLYGIQDLAFGWTLPLAQGLA